MPSGKKTPQAVDSKLWSFELKRAIIGGLALACLLLAGLIYVASPDVNNVLLASSLRIGVVLFAIWLALPQLRGLLAKVPEFLPVFALVLVVLCAVRPKVFSIVGSLIVVATALFAISNWIRSVTGKK